MIRTGQAGGAAVEKWDWLRAETGKTQEKYTSVAEMVRSVSDDQQFADEFDRRVNSRRLVKHLFAMRSAEGLSRKDLADRIGCSQSRISKLESGIDENLRLADLAAYLSALDLDLCLVFGQKVRRSLTRSSTTRRPSKGC
jgi:DNA-binding Xre family transcriptional regulator